MTISKAIVLSESQQEALRIIASFCGSEYSGKWVAEGNLSQIRPNTLRAMIAAGWVICKSKDGQMIYQLSVRGWEVRRSLIGSHLDTDLQKGDLFYRRDGRTWRVTGIAPGEVVFATYNKEDNTDG